MYIFELGYKLIVKLIKKFKTLKTKNLPKQEIQEPPQTDFPPNDLEDASTCSHIFLPIDSTKKILACTKCGLVVKKENLKRKPPVNFFEGR